MRMTPSEKNPVAPNAASLDVTLHLPKSYISRAAPEYFNDAPNLTGDIVYQPDVYALADYLVRTTGRSTVLDIGCGSARKLLALQARRRIGLDFAANIETCRVHTPSGTWLEIDLERGSLPELADFDARDAIVVNSDVIEHLVDPRNLIRILAKLHDAGAIVLVSTPDRPRSRGADHLGPPGNPAHTREWALDELVQLLDAEGLPSAFAGYTINNTRRPKKSTILTIHDRALSQARGNATPGTAPIAFIRPGGDDGTRAAQRTMLEAQGITVAEATPGAREAMTTTEPQRWTIELPTDTVPVSPWPELTVAKALATIAAAGAQHVNHAVFLTGDVLPGVAPPTRVEASGIMPDGPVWRRGSGAGPLFPYAAPAFRYGAALSSPPPSQDTSFWKRLRHDGLRLLQGAGEPVDPQSFHVDFLAERLSDVATARAPFLARLR